MPLLKPLLTPQTIPNTLIVILLDWSQPWSWLRQLRQWIRSLRSLLVSLDNDSKDVMEEAMISWRDRGRGGSKVMGTEEGSLGGGGDVSLPLGPGEWDEGLGIPLCVVCQNVIWSQNPSFLTVTLIPSQRPRTSTRWRRTGVGKKNSSISSSSSSERYCSSVSNARRFSLVSSLTY